MVTNTTHLASVGLAQAHPNYTVSYSRPVRATITLYPIGRPVRVTTTILYVLYAIIRVLYMFV